MSEKHESENKPREWVCSNGTIVTEYGPGAGVLAGRLHLESTAGETVLVPAAELLQFLSDYDQERQLAEVTAERDAIRQQLATTDACRELNQKQRDEWRERAEQAITERDALKRRVEELEQRRQPHAKGPCTCGAPEWCST